MSEQEDPGKPEVHAEDNSIAIGRISTGDVNAPLVIGDGNKVTVYATPEADAPLSSEGIEKGLNWLNGLLPERAPVLQTQFAATAQKLRATLGADMRALSPTLKKQREEQLEVVKQMCMEVTDISFHALCIGQKPPPYDRRCPFRGLESFGPQDWEFFFGREELIKKLVGRMKTDSFLAVLGASGSGKSSLVMAGLIPALGLDYAIFRPGTDPLGGLKSAREKPLIVVDQFEELFTLTRDKVTRNVFITALLATTQKVIITMRSDFLGEIASYRDLNEKIQTHLENIPPMNAEELQQAMEKQASQVCLRFESDLSQQILEDVEGEPGAMPLLQHALWELWNRRHGHLLPASEYRAFGGVKQAITRTAEKVYNECTKSEQERIRDIFLQLTYIDEQENRRDTRRRISLADLTAAGQNSDTLTLLLDKLATARLIVETPGSKLPEVEVAHEALIRHWKRLRTWINENRNNLIFQRQLIDDASQWNRNARHASYLYQDKRLSDAEQWAKANSSMLGFLEKEFLNIGRVKRNRERRTTLFRRVSIGIAVASLVAIAIFAFTGGLKILIYQPLPMDWVKVPAREFQMGSKLKKDGLPVHQVYLDSFQIGTYEVTNEQYLQCVKAGRCRAPRNDIYNLPKYLKHPVTGIDGIDAVTFCTWTVPKEYTGSLPTEAQWEKAARGIDGRTYPWGEDIDCDHANYLGCVQDTTPVGSYELGKSPYGAYDMAGNVWEWVKEQDRYLEKGGSWERPTILARSAIHEMNDLSAVGFRCVRSMKAGN